MISDMMKKFGVPYNFGAVAGVALILAVIVTRGSHFGNAALLPDATLAALFLGGILLKRTGWLVAFLAAAFIADAWAVNFQNVSSFCITPAYLGLIPTYAAVWACGWLFSRSREDAFSPAGFALAGFAAASLAFVVSNVFWFVFSGYFGQMPLSAFVASVSKYAVSYIGYTMLYLGIAWAAERVSRVRVTAKPGGQTP